MNKLEQTSAEHKGFFWKIEDAKGNKGYLLGSIHLCSQELIETNSKIMKCWNKAQCLAVEVNIHGEIDNQLTYLQKAELTKLVNKLNENARKNLSKTTLDYIKAIDGSSSLNDHDDKSIIVNGFLKFYNLLTESSNIVDTLGGMEEKFISLAKERSFEIHDLEDIDTYIRKTSEAAKIDIETVFYQFLIIMLSNPTDATEFKNILQNLTLEAHKKNLNFKQEMEKLGVLDNWKAGNLDFFEKWNQRETDPNSPGEHNDSTRNNLHEERKARNIEMAANLVGLVIEGKRPFALVGTRHTVGDGSSNRFGEGSVQYWLELFGLKVTRL